MFFLELISFSLALCILGSFGNGYLVDRVAAIFEVIIKREDLCIFCIRCFF